VLSQALPFFCDKRGLKGLKGFKDLRDPKDPKDPKALKTLASSKNKVGRRLFYIPAHNAPSIK
jgi:hypothetical protein